MGYHFFHYKILDYISILSSIDIVDKMNSHNLQAELTSLCLSYKSE